MIPFVRKQSTPAAAAEALALVVFGRPSGAKVDMAGVFDGKGAEAAKQAAEVQKLGWFEADTPERQHAAQGLPKGGFVTPGRFDLKAVDGATLALLTGLAGVVPGEGGDAASEAPEATVGGPQGTRAGDPADQGAEVGATGAPTTGRRGPWRDIATNQIVLAPSWLKRQFEGFWEARVVGFDGDDVMLEWTGYEKSLPRFWLKRSQIALLHPDYVTPQ